MELPKNLVYHAYHDRLSLVVGEVFGGGGPVERLLAAVGAASAGAAALFDQAELYEDDGGRGLLLRAWGRAVAGVGGGGGCACATPGVTGGGGLPALGLLVLLGLRRRRAGA